MQTFFYNAGVSALFTHELDAVLRQEWVLLFVLRDLPSVEASWWFIYLHFPIFLTVLYFGNSTSTKVKDRFRFLVSAFLLIHAGIHFRLSDLESYHFDHGLSELLIFGAGLFGLLYIANALRVRYTP